MTLLEMSIVILLVGFLFFMFFAVIFGLTRVTSLASPESRIKARAFLALENVRSSIDQTYFHRDVKQLWFLGDEGGSGEDRADRLTFACVHANADDLGVAAVREVSFYLEEDRSASKTSYVLFRREDELVDEKPGTGGRHYELMRNVVSLRFRYSLNGRDWRDDWDSTKLRRIPRMVEVRIQIEGPGGNRTLYETVAQPGLYTR